MGAREDRLRKIAAGLNYRLVKNKPKSEDLKWEIFLLVGTCIKGLKKMTPRAAIMRAALHPNLNKILDKHFKGPKRAAFDDDAQKEYNTDKEYFVQDILTKGEFKRFKLLERTIKLDMNAVRAMLDPDYRPAGDKVVVRKRKYKKS